MEKYHVALLSRSDKVVLVPYRRHHVLKYHDWMCDPALLEATASEPLTLEEEYAMQQTWRDDPKKVTFIVLAGDKMISELREKGLTIGSTEEDRMAGDVNLFLNDSDDLFNAEIEVMIAEHGFRNLGIAREALLMLMLFGISALGIKRYFAKINEKNVASLSLFKSLGYIEVNYVAAFQEYELEIMVSSALVETLQGQYTKVSYVDLPFVQSNKEGNDEH